MCVIEVDGYCTVWREQARNARKRHKCNCCGGTIEPGMTYIDHFSIYDGNSTAAKCCLACEDDRKEFAAAHGGYRSDPWYFPQTVADCIGEGDPDDARWKTMLDRIRRRKGEPCPAP